MGYEVSSGQVSSYISLTDDFMYVFSGGIANETTVNTAGIMYIEDGGTANDTIVNASGSMSVAGTANKTIVNGSGYWKLGKVTVLNGGVANSTTVNSGGSMIIDQGGTADTTIVNDCGSMHVFNGGAAGTTTVNSGGSVHVDVGGTVNAATVNSGGFLDVQKGGAATAIMENGGYVNVTDGANVTFVANSFKDLQLLNGSATLHSGTTATSTTVNDFGRLYVYADGSADATIVNSGGNLYVSSGGTTGNTTVNELGNMSVDDGGVADTTIVNAGSMHVESGGTANKTTVNDLGCMFVFGTANETVINGVDFGELYIYEGGVANRITVNSGGNVIIDGTANSTTVNADGYLEIAKGGRHTGTLTIAEGAVVSACAGSILDFDITAIAPENTALVNDLSHIQGTPDYTLTVSGSQESGIYLLAAGATEFADTITVKNTAGESLGTLTVGKTETINGTDYLLTNEGSELSVTVGDDTPSMAKWTYLVYMAADSNISFCALYDIVSMQQATIDSEIEVYVLADRPPEGTEGNGDWETINGTYKWDSLWPDTRVGKVTYSPGLTVTVDWESWGELDTGSISTLERFVDWAQEKSPAENYGLIVWDHGGENAELCWDLTTDPKWKACFTISEVSELVKEKGNIPIVIFNNCLLGSELVVTQMAGSTEVIVASEPTSYGMSTYNYNVFFNTITHDMTAQEMAAILVRNVEAQDETPGEATMLTSIDVTTSKLAEPLEALAEAVAAADNIADKTVLINALLVAQQDGCLYDGSEVQQSDLGDMILQAMEDPDYASTSEGFKKALADVMTALDAIVLEYRSVPSGMGSGIAICNTVCTAEKLVGSGKSTEKADATVKSYIISNYKSNPLWGGLLYDLCAMFLEQDADEISPPASFNVSFIDGLVEGRTVPVSDLSCFSGTGELFKNIQLIGETFFSFLITAKDKSTGKFFAANDIGADVSISLMSSDGTIIASGVGSVSFEDLAEGNYYLKLQSGTNCHVTLISSAEFMTGVDRFDYAGSGQNEAYVNGNGSIDKATPLDEGYYSGLITYKGDTDYYRIGNIHTEQYQIQLKGQDGWTVAEYDKDGTFVRSAEIIDGKYILMMDSMNYLLVEGNSDLKEAVGSYDFYVIGIDNDYTDVVELDNLAGTKDEVSWESSTVAPQYIVELSTDSFGHVLNFDTTGTAVDLLGLPAGTYQWRVMANSEDEEQDNPWYVGEEFVSDNTNDKPRVFQSKSDASDDLFFATPNGTWNSRYSAKHVGSVNEEWSGTGELVSAKGKGRIQDLFFGSADPGTLCLTDSDNGDALFLDDVYTGLPDEIKANTARLFRLRYINAGAGDDIVDMTSQRFEYTGSKLSIYGGDGDDVIWANQGKNMLFGDAGNDRIVGASGNDVIVGGIGDDRMHGGGGNDIFTFCENWGVDTIEQLATGSVTLWFLSGDESNWNAETLTYMDGENSVTVSGVSADSVTLKFGPEQSEVCAELYNNGAFSEFASQKIFEQSGILAY